MKEVYDIQNLVIGQISTVNNTPSGIINLKSNRIFIYEQLPSKKDKKEKIKYKEVFTEEDSYNISGVLKDEDVEKQEFGKIYLINNVDITNYLNDDEKLVGKVVKKRLLDIYQQIIFDYAKKNEKVSSISDNEKQFTKNR